MLVFMKRLFLFLNSFLHFLVDAVCLAVIFYIGKDYALLIPLYNTLAFSTQCLVGVFTDKFNRHIILVLLSCIIIVLGTALPLADIIKICLIGIGNSIFHVSAGTIALINSDEKASGLGVFVAPGAIGVFVGTNFPNLIFLLATALFLVSLIHFYVGTKANLINMPTRHSKEMNHFGIAVLLSLVVMVRAVGGSVVHFSWNTGLLFAFIMTFFVFLGKFSGGFICDKFGVNKVTLVSVPIAALLIIFGNSIIYASLLGQYLLNVSMPITLWLMYKSMPDCPGFSFGLAASVLWPGTILGQYLSGDNVVSYILIGICFAFSMLVIIISDNKLKKE